MPAGKPDRNRTAHRWCNLPGRRRARGTCGHHRRTHRCIPRFGHTHHPHGLAGALDRMYLRNTRHRRTPGGHSARRHTPGRTNMDRRRRCGRGIASSRHQARRERRAPPGRNLPPRGRRHTASRPHRRSRAVPPPGQGPGCSRADCESSRRTPRPIRTARSARAACTSPPEPPVRSPRGEPTQSYMPGRSRSRRSTRLRQVLQREHRRKVPEEP